MRLPTRRRTLSPLARLRVNANVRSGETMKAMIALITMILCAVPSFAELRIIGVSMQKATNGTIQVAISSDVKEENRTSLTMSEAQAILQNAKGWGSTVVVGIQAHNLRLAEYMPLLKVISENIWLELAFVEGQSPDFIVDNIKKRIEQQGGGYSPPAARSSKPTP